MRTTSLINPTSVAVGWLLPLALFAGCARKASGPVKVAAIRPSVMNPAPSVLHLGKTLFCNWISWRADGGAIATDVESLKSNKQTGTLRHVILWRLDRNRPAPYITGGTFTSFPAWLGTSDKLVVSHSNGQAIWLYSMDSVNKSLTQVPALPGYRLAVVGGPTGAELEKGILLLSASDRAKRSQICLWDRRRNEVRALSHQGDADCIEPVASRAPTMIAYRERKWHLDSVVVVSYPDMHVVFRTDPSTGSVKAYAFDPRDGSLIYTIDGNAGGELHRVALPRRTDAIIARAQAFEDLVSVRGTNGDIATVVKENGGPGRIYIYRLDGRLKEAFPRTAATFCPAWSPGGRFLAYCSTPVSKPQFDLFVRDMGS